MKLENRFVPRFSRGWGLDTSKKGLVMSRFITFALLALAFANDAQAKTGERFFIEQNNTKIYSAPNASAPVVTRLDKGDRVMEWRRQGPWVKISQMGGRVGSDGWVRLSRLVPNTEGERKIEIEMDRAGQFRLDAQVNGITITFLVDTGATGIFLSPGDAEKLGFQLDRLDYLNPARTAGGIVRTASVGLNEISIGNSGIGRFSLRNVDAQVNGRRTGISLLGMSFLNRLGSFEVRNEKLVLRW
jgi:clan AA aspartic protease (TIGR02281 family)